VKYVYPKEKASESFWLLMIPVDVVTAHAYRIALPRKLRLLHLPAANFTANIGTSASESPSIRTHMLISTFTRNSKNYLVQFLANDKTALSAKMALERIRQSGRRVRGRGRAERRNECVYMPHPHSALDVLVLLDYSTTIFLPTRFEVADGARPCSCQTEHTRRYTQGTTISAICHGTSSSPAPRHRTYTV
jgi:hypothetical protein